MSYRIQSKDSGVAVIAGAAVAVAIGAFAIGARRH
jgi:hypothetical protein